MRKARHRGADEAPFSLDSFLDIVTNVVGVLVLVAMVTVLSAGNISVPSGASAMTAPRPSAERVLFECAGDQIFFVDEEGNGRRILEQVWHSGEHAITGPSLVALLDEQDVGDDAFRVRADRLPNGVAWSYSLRAGARGERSADLDRPGSAFRARMAALDRGGFVYFVVREDGFDVFRKARDIARAGGVSVGWHPVEQGEPLVLSAVGSLGKRVQ